MEDREGLKPIPEELMKHLSSEYTKQEKDSFLSGAKVF
jgi:hypothetical protein